MRALLLPRSATLICAAIAMLALSAPALAADASVTIKDFAFTPPELTVALGTKVIFRNEDSDVHSVVADDGSFHSNALDTGSEFAHTFNMAGVTSYHCGLHPTMQGRIVVK